MDGATLDAIDEDDPMRKVAAAEAEARAAPEPRRTSSRPQVWADGGSTWRN